jgi:hypothetical protein
MRMIRGGRRKRLSCPATVSAKASPGFRCWARRSSSEGGKRGYPVRRSSAGDRTGYALLPRSDIGDSGCDVGFGPEADVHQHSGRQVESRC